MVTVPQIFFALLLILLIIYLVFQRRRKQTFIWPDNYQDLLKDYVRFYVELDEEVRKQFKKNQNFLSAVKITGANAEVEDVDRCLKG